MEPKVDFELNIKWTKNGHLLVQLGENEFLEVAGARTVKEILENLQVSIINNFC